MKHASSYVSWARVWATEETEAYVREWFLPSSTRSLELGIHSWTGRLKLALLDLGDFVGHL